MCNEREPGWKPRTEGALFLPRLSVDDKMEIYRQLATATALCGAPGVPVELKEAVDKAFERWTRPEAAPGRAA